MNKQNKFTLKEAKSMLKDKGLDRLIIIGIKETDTEYENQIITYGKTKKLCSQTGDWVSELQQGIDYFITRDWRLDNE